MKLKNQNPSGKELSTFHNKLNINKNEKIIAIWGYPEPVVLAEILNKYPKHKIIDLDIPYGAPETKLLPDNYCQIITNILDNALALKDNIELIVASTGEEKCDQGRFAAYILDKFGLPVIKTKYTEYDNTKNIVPVISQSTLPLKKKVLLIMDSIIKPDLLNNYTILNCKPTHGFWGVPPNDLDILDLFPNTTHVYGWTRCVEMKRPADIDLEMTVDKNVPTVFFAQTFCAKMQLAKFLAKKYEGLYVDVDDLISVSVKAKIEAFLRLS